MTEPLSAYIISDTRLDKSRDLLTYYLVYGRNGLKHVGPTTNYMQYIAKMASKAANKSRKAPSLHTAVETRS